VPRDLLAEQSAGRDLLSETPKVSAANPAPRDLIEGSRSTNPTPFLATERGEQALAFSIGGPLALLSGVRNTEEALPFVGGVLGGVGGSLVGHPHVGVGVGVGAGDLARQSINKLKGEGDDISASDAVTLGTLTALGGKAFDVALKSAGVTLGFIPDRAKAKIFDKTAQATNIARKQLSRIWDKSVTNLANKFPDQRVNLKPAFTRLQKQFNDIDEQMIPQIKAAIKKNKKLNDIVKFSGPDDKVIGFAPDKTIGVTLKEANEFRATINAAIKPITKRALRGETLPTERVAFEILDEFDDAITGSFKEMSLIKRTYREGRKAFEMVRPLVQPGEAIEKTVLSQPRGLFGLEGTPFFRSQQGRVAAQKLLSNTEAGANLFSALKFMHVGNRAVDAIARLTAIKVGSKVIGIGDSN
jgi:hypothetical protein